VFLWTSRKKKPIFKLQNAHKGNWIGALAVLPNSDLFATGACDHKLNIYQLTEDIKSFKVIAQLPTEGIVTDLKLHGNTLFAVLSD
jgi:ribosomal RNA-processing protein 9